MKTIWDEAQDRADSLGRTVAVYPPCCDANPLRDWDWQTADAMGMFKPGYADIIHPQN